MGRLQYLTPFYFAYSIQFLVATSPVAIATTFYFLLLLLLFSFCGGLDNTWNTINCFVPTEMNLTTELSNASVSAVEEFWT